MVGNCNQVYPPNPQHLISRYARIADMTSSIVIRRQQCMNARHHGLYRQSKKMHGCHVRNVRRRAQNSCTNNICVLLLYITLSLLRQRTNLFGPAWTVLRIICKPAEPTNRSVSWLHKQPIRNHIERTGTPISRKEYVFEKGKHVIARGKKPFDPDFHQPKTKEGLSTGHCCFKINHIPPDLIVRCRSLIDSAHPSLTYH